MLLLNIQIFQILIILSDSGVSDDEISAYASTDCRAFSDCLQPWMRVSEDSIRVAADVHDGLRAHPFSFVHAPSTRHQVRGHPSEIQT